MGESLAKHHDDHIAGKGNNSSQHRNLVHKFIRLKPKKNPATSLYQHVLGARAGCECVVHARRTHSRQSFFFDGVKAFDLEVARGRRRGIAVCVAVLSPTQHVFMGG